MPSAKLIKTLEKEGFELEFPSYENLEEIILEVIKEGDYRLSTSLSLFLKYEFDYALICKKLNKEEKKDFDRAILISNKIYQKEGIDSRLNSIISENKIKASFKKEDFDKFYDSFKEADKNKVEEKEKIIEKQSKLRLNLDMNKSLKVLFSPAKIRIMDKIFNHQKLTNTELKYYYKSISNINKSVLNKNLQDYLRIIEITKKEKY
jgi:hypothetical protein